MAVGGWVWLSVLLASLVSVSAEAAAPEFHQPAHWWRANHSRYTQESPDGRCCFSVESCLVCHGTVESCNTCHEWVGVRRMRGEDDPAAAAEIKDDADDCTYCHLPGEFEGLYEPGRVGSGRCPGLTALDREMRLLEMHLTDMAGPSEAAAGEASKSYRSTALEYRRIMADAGRGSDGSNADLRRLRGGLYRGVFQPLVQRERDWKAGAAIRNLTGGALIFAILALLGIWRRRRMTKR